METVIDFFKGNPGILFPLTILFSLLTSYLGMRVGKEEARREADERIKQLEWDLQVMAWTKFEVRPQRTDIARITVQHIAQPFVPEDAVRHELMQKLEEQLVTHELIKHKNGVSSITLIIEKP